jgi:hypothetical protein
MKPILSMAALLLQLNLLAQQPLTLTDSTPVTVNGLQAGYSITGEKEKEVGNKGDFSRFQVEFYVTNTSSEAKIMLHRQGFSIGGNGVSPNIVQFRCSNATGARLTSKEWALQAKPCTIEALVDDAEPSTNKIVQNRRMANIGYWIRPGETISIKNVVIVPLNEKPGMTVTFFPGPINNMVGSVINSNDNYNNNQYTDNNNRYPVNNNQFSVQGFVRIKNFESNNYLHNQNGPVACTGIDRGWWSAQWEILPVNGTNYFVIRNRWKNNYISTENGSMISDNSQSANAQWSIEEEPGGNHTYTIKNAANNAKLVYQNGVLRTVAIFGTQPNMQWVIEQ